MAAPQKADIEENGPVLRLQELTFEDISNETLSPEEDKRLVRKIDKALLPVCAVSYLFQFLDKITLNAAAIMGIQEDLQLTGQEYSWANSIYYVGFLLASYPAAWLLIRLKVGKTISTSMARANCWRRSQSLVWGACLMLTAACFNAASLWANRFFLGVSESVVAPGLTVVISMWYKRPEQPLRHAAWFLGNTGAGLFGGYIVYGIAHISTLKPWMAVFIIFGAMTVAWSLATFFLLPDSPMEAQFLSDDERRKAVLRVKENMTGIKNDQVKWDQVKEAFLDIKTWLLVVHTLSANIPNGAASAFQAVVTKGFGFTFLEVLLLGSIPFAVQFVLVLSQARGSSYFENSRTYFMAFNSAAGIAGTAMVRFVPQDKKWTRYFGTVVQSASAANFPLVVSLISGNFGGFTKKTTVNAVIFVSFCLGNIIGPLLFFEDEAPTYQSGFLAMLICMAVGFVAGWLIRGYLMWANRRRDKLMTAEDVAAFEAAQHGVMANLTDMTDKQIPQFRYVY